MTLTRSEWMKQVWARPGHREKMTKIRNSSEYKEKHSKACKEKWADPEYRKKRSELAKKQWTNPEFREKMSQVFKEKWANPEYQDPEYREKVSQAFKEVWARPGYREKMVKIYNSSEHKEKMSKIYQSPEFRKMRSKSAREQWKTSEFRERMTGENSPLWRGGTSKHPYPFEFGDEFKQKIKERDEYKCVLCGVEGILHVHHINYIKEDLRSENLITLCVSCHSKTNYNRDYWEVFLTTLTEQMKAHMNYGTIMLELEEIKNVPLVII